MTDLTKDNRTNFWIVLAIYISIFINSLVFFQKPFEFYIGYLIYIVLLPVFASRHVFNKNLVAIFFVLLASGFFSIFLGNNTPALFFKVYTGLLLSYLFYDYVIKEFEYDIEQLFKWYLYGCYIAALIGIVQFISFQIDFVPGYKFHWIFNKWGVSRGGNFGIRVNSVFGEPTYLGAVLSASFFVSIYNLFRKETYYLTRLQSMCIIVVYILSFSGLGQVGILLTFLFLAINFGLVRYFMVAIPVGILLFNLLYNNSRDFKDRYDSLVNLFETEGKFELGKTHGSSFILYNNYHVALENFKGNFFFGTGVGSHPIAFEKYSVAKDIEVYGFNLNSADANSMLLRLISETGSFGVLLFFVIMFKCYVKRDEDHDTFHWLVSNGILIMILLNLFRQGHYFINGFPFFVLLYIYNSYAYQEYLDQVNEVGQISEQPETEVPSIIKDAD
jgi:hypothetical protein